MNEQQELVEKGKAILDCCAIEGRSRTPSEEGQLGEIHARLKELSEEGHRKDVNSFLAGGGTKIEEIRAAGSDFGRPGDAEGKILQKCHAPNCQAMPVNEHGHPIPVIDRRWWCGKHRDQAAPGDDLPPEPKYVLDLATMSPRAVGEERERLLEEDRQREQKAREREQLRREESERLRKLEEEYRASLKPTLTGFE